MEKSYLSQSEEETWKIAKEVLHHLGSTNVIVLQGELGAGKTTFSQGLLKALGAEGPFTSPTFVIMKRYDLVEEAASHGFKHVYHLDCYRVGEQDVLDLGWQEIINDPQSLVIVEWPEKIKGILPDNYLLLEFEIVDEQKRGIKIHAK